MSKTPPVYAHLIKEPTFTDQLLPCLGVDGDREADVWIEQLEPSEITQQYNLNDKHVCCEIPISNKYIINVKHCTYMYRISAIFIYTAVQI